MSSQRSKRSTQPSHGTDRDRKERRDDERPSREAPRSTRRESPPPNTRTYDAKSVKPQENYNLSGKPPKFNFSEAVQNLSELVRGFLQPSAGDYDGCEAFCKQNPAIWSRQDEVKQFLNLATESLRQGRAANAQRFAERWLMLSIAGQQGWKAADANEFLRGLRKNSESRESFETSVQNLIQRIEPTDDISDVEEDGAKYSKAKREINTDRAPSESGRRPSANLRASFSSSVTSRQDDLASTRSPRSSQLAILTREPTREPMRESTRESTREPPRDSGRGPPREPLGASDRAPAREITRQPTAPSARPPNVNPRSLPPNPNKIPTVGSMTTGGQSRTIESGTDEVGPNPNFLEGFENKDDLDESYILRERREAAAFFIRGRVFAMVWHENAGRGPSNSSNITEPLDKPFHTFTLNRDRVRIFSHIRRFVVIKPRSGYCWAIPIISYGGHGLAAKKMSEEEKQAHTIVYPADGKPRYVRDEDHLDKRPIAVKMAPNQTLTSASRLHFGRPQSIDYNIKMRDVGLISGSTDLRRLMTYFREEFFKDEQSDMEQEDEEDDDDDEEAPVPRPEKRYR